MTTKEKQKCENLLGEAISKATLARLEYSEAEKYEKNHDDVNAEISFRKGDNHMGYAYGIHQILAVLGYKSGKMRELENLM